MTKIKIIRLAMDTGTRSMSWLQATSFCSKVFRSLRESIEALAMLASFDPLQTSSYDALNRSERSSRPERNRGSQSTGRCDAYQCRGRGILAARSTSTISVPSE